MLATLVWGQTGTNVAVDGLVCGSSFHDSKVNHPVGGEFEFGGSHDGLTRWCDHNEFTVVRTNEQEQIVSVEGHTLKINGVLLARKGESEAKCRARGRIVKNPVDTRYGKVAWKLEVSQGVVTGVSASLKP